ncbi:uncharacterized protein LOC123509682 [Portunus trituberculatus]|uniref:uncharacterized protein LOC123509682 n=1 Tax=Portunus trituberculatus TaxID=210409 RepID=UPI001E1D126A|nr:uncharacterized protein LOC123509682 [Portunus trituberculatus]
MVDDLSTEALIQRFQEECRSCTYPTDATSIKKRYKDTALILFKEDLDDGSLRNYLTFGTRRSSSVSQYGNTPVVIRRSRSSNGELTTVVEQVSALQGRSTRSNYTLLEAGEKDTDSDFENDFQESRFNSDDSFAIKENYEKDSKHKADSTESIQKDQVHEASNVDTQSTVHLQESTSTINDQQSQEHNIKKSFSHNDPSAHPCRDNVEVEAIQLSEEYRKHDKKRISKNSEEIKTEMSELSAFDENKQLTAEIHKDHISSASSGHSINQQVPDDSSLHTTSEEKDASRTFLLNTCEPTSIITNDKVQKRRSTPEIDHAAILREFVQQPSRRSKSLPQSKNEANLSAPETSIREEPKKNLKYVELKIVESSDNIFEQGNREIDAPDTEKALTTSDIPHLSDESDVVFIDAGSPSLSRAKFSCDSCSGSTEEVLQSKENSYLDKTIDITAATPQTSESSTVNLDKNVDTQDKSIGTYQDPGSDTVSKNSETKKEEITTRRRHDSHNSFRDLPIRSPTPPRRKPQKSPRTPKLREKTRNRNSSLALTSDEEAQELLANGTRSASPTSKTGDLRFFSFSLRKEKSKSATNLGSKRNRDRVRLTSVKLSLEDPGAVNPKLASSRIEDSHLDNSGKRVGVRSMMIDGTIKRNFIVIHPSDDSDTIGLAPMTPQADQKEITPVSTPEALSTVKTRITAPNPEKLEVMKRISSQTKLKEELSDIPENLKDESRGSFRGSFSVSHISRSLRIKQNKKNLEHLPLKTSHSLSSEPVCPSPSSSQILYKSPSSLSRVDCDSPVSAQKVHHTGDSRTVSKFCVVM